MKDLITESLTGAMSRLHAHANLVGLPNTDEFTFRSFLMAEIMKRNPSAQCQTEWRRVDLLVQAKSRNALVELKFYLYRRTIELDGEPGKPKGGPGPKNEGEFRDCVEKLRRFQWPGITDKFLVLVYEVGNPRKSRYSYDGSYDDLGQFGLDQTYKIGGPQRIKVVCRMANIPPAT